MRDFRHVEKIDAHMHVHGRADRLMAQAIADHFRILTINVDAPDYPPIREQRLAAVALRRLEMWRRAEADRIQVVVVVRLALAGNAFAIAWPVQRLVR